MRSVAAALIVGMLVIACSDQPTDAEKVGSPVEASLARYHDAGMGAGHAVLCSNQSGSVFVRPQCHANEQQLDPAALGLVGPAGPGGVSGYEIVTHQEVLSHGPANVHVDCPTGKKVLGGGFNIETPAGVQVFSSEPSDGQGNIIDHGWNILVENTGTSTRQTTAIAICASVQ